MKLSIRVSLVILLANILYWILKPFVSDEAASHILIPFLLFLIFIALLNSIYAFLIEPKRR